MKKKISLIINLIITLLTIFASIVMFFRIKITSGVEPVLETTKLGMFKFFTVDSNFFMGIVSLLFVIRQIKKQPITRNMYILKLISTTSVALTFIVVLAYLAPISAGGIVSMLQNSNLFFHLIIPILSIINFSFFESTNELKISDTVYGIFPTIIYAVFYLLNIIIHLENGGVSTIYDWYWFAQNGVVGAIIIAFLMIISTYIITLILWWLNRRKIK